MYIPVMFALGGKVEGGGGEPCTINYRAEIWIISNSTPVYPINYDCI